MQGKGEYWAPRDTNGFPTRGITHIQAPLLKNNPKKYPESSLKEDRFPGHPSELAHSCLPKNVAAQEHQASIIANAEQKERSLQFVSVVDMIAVSTHLLICAGDIEPVGSDRSLCSNDGTRRHRSHHTGLCHDPRCDQGCFSFPRVERHGLHHWRISWYVPNKCLCLCILHSIV